MQQDDWDRHWEDLETANLINPAQEYRHRLVLNNLQLDTSDAPRVLDVGSGIGEFLRILDSERPEIPKLGLEVSRGGVEVASRRVPGATFLQRDLINDSGDPADKFRNFATHAVCSEVLEHVDNPVALLKNARRYMADGCRFVVTVPGGPQSEFDRHIGHRRHFSPADLRRMLEDAGFTVELSSGAGFPFFNVYRLLVIMRGQRLVKDASGKPSALLKLSSAAFGVLFKLNISRSPWGWQTWAVARK